MANTALIAVLSFLVIFTIANNGINANEALSAADTYGYVKMQAAQEAALSAVDLAQSMMDNGAMLPISGTIAGATYTCTSAIQGSTLVVTTQTVYEDSTYTSVTSFKMAPKPSPTILAALMLHSDPLASTYVYASSNAKADGHNYDSTGTTILSTLPAISALAVETKSDSTTAAAWNVKPQVPFGMTSYKPLSLSTTAAKIVINAALSAPSLYTPEYEAEADSTIVSGSTLTGSRSWGTASAPQIIYIAGDSIHTTVIGGTIQGWGVLDLQGNVSFTGSFTWHGLVIGHSGTALDFSGTSTAPTFVGATLLDSPRSGNCALKAAATFKYSSSAVALALRMPKLQAYQLVGKYN